MDFKSAEAIAREQGLMLTTDHWILSAEHHARWSADRRAKCVAFRWDGSVWRDNHKDEPMQPVLRFARGWRVTKTDIVQALSCVC